jgi:RRM-like domain
MVVSLTVYTFETIDDAERAKDALDGADIYSGCCTLKIQWGKVSGWPQNYFFKILNQLF